MSMWIGGNFVIGCVMFYVGIIRLVKFDLNYVCVKVWVDNYYIVVLFWK